MSEISEMNEKDIRDLLEAAARRAPVVVGYVTEYEAFGLRQPNKDSAPWVGYRRSSKRFVPVYLDPQPPSKEPV